MSSQLLKLISLSSLALSIFIGNSAAFAQIDSGNDGVVVPTVPSDGSTSTDRPIPTDSSSIPSSSRGVDRIARFGCQYYNGQYTVMYQPQSQPGQFFPWAAPATLGGGWNSQLRCQTIANRLESYRQDGLLELQTGYENRQNTVCVTTEADASCRIVLTVPPNRDPYTVRNSVFQNLTAADNGQQTTAVNTYRNGRGDVDELYNLGSTLLGSGNNRVSTSRRGINLKPFLDPKDGGTAINLRNGVAIRRQSQPGTSNRQAPVRLNPGNFR
ncbi:MAG: COP23 domain-containing protein [Desmonostoc vinosum HA7617-LM4]|jgi:hypothetical protein|nr:COP23 domain-containing protein [Desmonostoc vinosum HA7617-LM4]